MLKRLQVAALSLAFCSTAIAQSASVYTLGSRSTPVRNVNVTANLAQTGYTIPSNFVGLSTEVRDFVAGFFQGTSGQWTSGAYTGNAASYCSIASKLGSSGVFRIGGGSADIATAPTITAGMATALNSFLGCLGNGWTLLYTLDLQANDSATAAATATALANAVGSANVTFQFGNEPSLIGINNATYISRWNAYYTAVIAAVPGAKLGTVDDVINPGWGSVPTTIASLTPGLAGLATVTEHWYPFCNGQFATAVPAIVLSQVKMQQRDSAGLGSGIIGLYLSNTQAYGSTPQRMSETNSICSGGQVGMSDRLMASTWFLDTAMNLVGAQWVGMNVHAAWGGFTTSYNPMTITANGNFTASPVFYGMFLFSKIQGQQTVSVAYSNSTTFVQSIATKGGGGNANILVTNSDAFNPVAITPDQSSGWTTANVLQIKSATGAGCGDASVTIGGQAIGESGTWSGTAFAISKGASITLGPCEAALIQIQP